MVVGGGVLGGDEVKRVEPHEWDYRSQRALWCLPQAIAIYEQGCGPSPDTNLLVLLLWIIPSLWNCGKQIYFL